MDSIATQFLVEPGVLRQAVADYLYLIPWACGVLGAVWIIDLAFWRLVARNR